MYILAMKYDKNWYGSLNKPAFQPPAWLFAPVWTVLYALMGISFLIIILEPFKLINLSAYILFFIQLGLNLSWSPVFFGAHKIKKAFYICLMLVLFVFLTILSFYMISKPAAILLIPYLLWVSFACFLNFTIWELNKNS